MANVNFLVENVEKELQELVKSSENTVTIVATVTERIG